MAYQLKKEQVPVCRQAGLELRPAPLKTSGEAKARGTPLRMKR